MNWVCEQCATDTDVEKYEVEGDSTFLCDSCARWVLDPLSPKELSEEFNRERHRSTGAFETDLNLPDGLVIRYLIGSGAPGHPPTKRVIECFHDGRIRYSGFPDPVSAMTDHRPFVVATVDEDLVKAFAEHLLDEGFGSLTGGSGLLMDGGAAHLTLDYRDVSRRVSWYDGARPPRSIAVVIRELYAGAERHAEGKTESPFRPDHRRLFRWSDDRD